MAQCVQSVQEFVQDSFVPMVAVLCSDEAERLTRKNKLNFAELLRPFCRLTSEGHLRDPNNQLQVVKNLRICVTKLVPGAAPQLTGATGPPPAVALGPGQRRRLNRVVLSCQPQEGAVSTAVAAGDYDLTFNATTPWFEAYRESFLQSMPASDHEFLNHYLACLLAVSSSEAVPVEQFVKLSQEQHRIQHSGDYATPKWFIPNTLKYYVLLHDVSRGDEQRAEAAYEDMKQRYGPQGCYLLKINSRTLPAEQNEQIPDPWSQYLHRNHPQISQDRDDDDDDDDDDDPAVSSNTEENGVIAAEDHRSAGTGAEGGRPDAVSDPAKKGAGEAEGPTEARGACLTLTDHDRIRQFVQEFTFRGLLPHIEKNIRQLNEQLVSRKGLSRSLFTATKKWFGGGKVPEKSVSEPKSTGGLLYSPEAPELQIRKMADLCFLVQHYELAYSCYHTAKKDFLSDQAMLYAAGALEMAAVSAFLQAGAARPYPAHYMDTAIQTYRDVCRNTALAERCALLSAEILKSQGKYSEAATLLIKMTSEDSDLRSALLLEQAAHCFMNMRARMLRKFAFHMILAGHRFSKAGQKRHALRCYCQAMQVYKGRSWSLAEDHINFTIGRQSFTLGEPEKAVQAFKQILTNDSRQTATQQGAFLREYLYVYKTVISRSGLSLPHLPLPFIHSAATRVYFGHERRLAEGEKQAATHVSLDQEYDAEQASVWRELEEQLVAAANRGPVPANFQPSQCYLNSQTDNLRHPLAVVEEPMLVEVMFRNPLKVPLALSRLSLLWKLARDGHAAAEDDAEELVGKRDALERETTQSDDLVTAETILDFHLAPEETKMARLRLLPHKTGCLSITGVVYNLAAASSPDTPDDDGNVSAPDRACVVRQSPTLGAPLPLAGMQKAETVVVDGKQDLKIRGPRLNHTKEDKMFVRYGPDRRLEPIITPPMPLMEVFFLQFPTALLCGEIRKAYVEFCNVSGVSLCGLRVASTHPDFFTFGSPSASTPVTPLSPASAENCSAYKTLASAPGSGAACETLVSADDFGPVSNVVDIPVGGALEPGQSTQLPLWLRGPDQEGVHEINFLFYYESPEKGTKISHRVVRHSVFICASRSLSIQASACFSAVPPQRGPDRDGGALVFVDVENINTSEAGVREFHVVQVSSSSQHWSLNKCINPAKEKDCKVSSRERAKLCFRATPCKPPQATSDNKEMLTFADVNLGNERIVSSATPCGDFFFRCRRTSESRRGNAGSSGSRTPSCSRNLSEDTRKDPLHMGNGCNQLDLNIIVIWKAYVVEDNKQLILEGQLHVALQAIGKEATSLTPKQEAQEMVLLKFKSDPPPPAALPSAQLSRLVKSNLHYSETYAHDFTRNSVCVVPVCLVLSNCFWTDVDVTVDLRHKTGSSESGECACCFAWVGQSRYTLALCPRETRRLQLRACFLAPGVYNINTHAVSAAPARRKRDDDAAPPEVAQHGAGPALVVITDSNQ
ncbi:LOW QUALITY PROTEIN: trafficking protein particle complex subunit 8 [Phyllopteryx taeniolatus]|uniref:LOW QUALITY PROTEIN: trafficking protein particle complex subunit 8 n=1 Tax=Phyllopteryx taeniolatus TaxID=161469 RepID=UPI002AD38EF2|nr:LOW QUALITY PROTEIN: trafficking protein particle complex subunit 8 [Phyllopteryx taeniolatus]